MGVVRGCQGTEDGVECMEETALDLASLPGVPLGEANEVIHVDVPIGERRMEVWGREGWDWPTRVVRGAGGGCGRLRRWWSFRDNVQAVGRLGVVNGGIRHVGDGFGCRAEVRRRFAPSHWQGEGDGNQRLFPRPRRKEDG